MKQNLYDVFDHWNADFQELPPLQAQPIRQERVQNLVEMQLGESIAPARKGFRVWGVLAAAAVLICGTLTVGAVSGKMEAFFTALSQTEPQDNGGNTHLPGVGEDPVSAAQQMEAYYSGPEVSFTETDNASVQLLGLYHDHSTVMLCFQLTVKDGTVLPSDAGMLSYYTLTTPEGTHDFPESGVLNEDLRQSDTDDTVYYFNCHLTDTALCQGTLSVEFAGIYQVQQSEMVQQEILALQQGWRDAFQAASGGTLDPQSWKAYWDAQDYDQQTKQAYRNAYAAQDSLLSGNWTADIPIDPATSEPINVTGDSTEAVVDELSIRIIHTWTENEIDAYPLITLKDGTILGGNFSTLSAENVTCRKFAAERTDSSNPGSRIYCYDKPITMAEIEKVEMQYCYVDDQGNLSVVSDVLS